MINEDYKDMMRKAYFEQLSKNGGCLEPMAFFCIITVIFLFFGCCPCKKIATDNNSNHESKDSVRVEIRYEKVTEYVHDTAYIHIPPQESVNHTLSDSSHLENQFCSSDARINPDGTLYHDLKTKEQDIPVEFEKPVTTITETEHHEHTSSDVSETNQTTTQYIERDYTWWDKTRFYASYILLGWLLINYRKFFKKLIISIFKKFVS